MAGQYGKYSTLISNIFPNGLTTNQIIDFAAAPGLTITTTSFPANGVPQDLNITTGDLNDPFAGFGTANINIKTGSDAEAGKSGDINLITGPASSMSSAVPGNINLQSANPGQSGAINLQADTIVLNANNGSGNIQLNGNVSISSLNLPAPGLQKYLSGSGTYTVPANTKYLRIVMVGGGGGGAGSSTNTAADGGSGADGADSTFGTSLLVAGGGKGATSSVPGIGGSASLGSGPDGLAIWGGAGSGTVIATILGIGSPGGAGGSSAFGGGGAGAVGANGATGQTNAGSGGGGGGGPASNSNGSKGGCGGGAGGYIDAIILSPASSYAYSVGNNGVGGNAGTSGFDGGSGGTGVILILAYFQ